MTDFSRRQAKELNKLLARPPVSSSSKHTATEAFVLRYIFMEATLRMVGNYYRQRGGSSASSAEWNLNIDVVCRSLRYFDIAVHPERLGLLLDSKRVKRNAKSARQLRNGLVHRWDASDAREVMARLSELFEAIQGLMAAVSRRAHSELSRCMRHTHRTFQETVDE
jgi:hypothetical protein